MNNQSNNIFSLKIEKFETQIINSEIVNFIFLSHPFEENKQIKVKGKYWHCEKYWDRPELNVIYDNGKYKIFDNYHPHFKIKNKYPFKYKSFYIKKDGNENTLILIVEDEYGIEHTVKGYGDQHINLKKEDRIDCFVSDISFKVFLRQSKFIDPYFSEFDMVFNSQNFKSKYFDKYVDPTKQDYNRQLHIQYTDRLGYWLFTFCNEVLKKEFFYQIELKNFSEAFELITKWEIAEEFMLNRNYKKTYQEKSDQDEFELKIYSTLKKIENYKKVLILILDKDYDKIYSDSYEIDFMGTVNYVLYNGIDFIDSEKIFQKIEKVYLPEKKSINNYYSHLLLDSIYKEIKEEYNLFQYYFFKKVKLTKVQIEKISRLLKWNIFLIKASELFQFQLTGTLYLAKYLRVFSLLIESKNKKSKLFFNSFFILNKGVIKDNDPINKISFNWNAKNIADSVDFEKLEFNPNQNSNYLEVWRGLKRKKNFRVRLIKKEGNGFYFNYDQITGFLPFQFVNDNYLKTLLFPKLQWETNVSLELDFPSLNQIVVRQLPLDSPDFYSENIGINELKIGQVIDAKVKSCTSFGVFVYTEFGEGLIHISNIGKHVNGKEDIERDFSGKLIKVVVLKVQNNKIEFGFYQLTKHGFKDYYDSFFVGIENEEVKYELRDERVSMDNFEYEKALIIESLSYFSEEIDKKIEFLKLARISYSILSNSRSYLINIYLNLFLLIKNLGIYRQKWKKNKKIQLKETLLNDLIEIQEETKNKFQSEFQNFELIKNSLLSIKDFSEDSFKNLFEQIDFKEGEFSDLKNVVLKSVLSIKLGLNIKPNLSIGEQENEIDIGLKGLHELLLNASYSFSQTEEDIKLKKQRDEIRKVINDEEGQINEFKSSIFYPCPNESNDKKIRKKFEYYNRLLKDSQTKDLNTEETKTLEGIKNELYGEKARHDILHSFMKNICAFINTCDGNIFIGINDKREIVGMDPDLKLFSENPKDNFQQMLINNLKKYFKDDYDSVINNLEFIGFTDFYDGEVFWIKIKKSEDFVYLYINSKGESDTEFFRKTTTSAEKLLGSQVARFIKQKTLENIKG